MNRVATRSPFVTYRCTCCPSARDPNGSDASDGNDPRRSSSRRFIAAVESDTRSTDSPAPPSIAKVEAEGRGFVISGGYLLSASAEAQ